jgi:hypothetical protein
MNEKDRSECGKKGMNLYSHHPPREVVGWAAGELLRCFMIRTEKEWRDERNKERKCK